MLELALAISAISAAAIFGAFYFLKSQVSSSVGAEREALTKKIPELLTQAEELLTERHKYASKAQLQAIETLAATIKADLSKEKENLKAIETRLETAQRDVETKETAQQELKTSREEEETQLEDMLKRLEDVSVESITLEQHLAASLKNLDQLTTEVTLTPDQKALFDDLANALTNASARLRDLLFEYNTVKDRLETLRQQHRDLEEEYTRLVEQQLGE